MTKKYDTQHVENELKGGASLFFTDPKRKDPAPTKTPPQVSAQEPERSNARTVERPNGRRIITRNSFEVYEDQMDALREKAYQEKREGKLGSMSAMVRSAIDKYLLDK